MKLNYIKVILKKFPDISSGRKNFKYFENRIKKNLTLTKKYQKSVVKTIQNHNHDFKIIINIKNNQYSWMTTFKIFNSFKNKGMG